MITKEGLKKLIKEVTANILAERDGDKDEIAVGPGSSAGSYRSKSSLVGAGPSQIVFPRAHRELEATPLEDRKREQELAQEFGGTVYAREQDPRKRASDARKARRKTTWDSYEYDKYIDAYKKEHGKTPTVAQLEKYMAGPRMPAPASKVDIYQVQKELNKAKNSGAITVATWREARRALQGSPRKNRLLDKIHGAGFADAVNAGTARAILDAGMAGSSVTTATTDLKEAYEVVPGSGEEGVSGISVPTQSMVRPEPEPEPEHGAAARKRKAERWAKMQGLEDYEDPTARFKPRANTRETSGIHPAEFEDVYAKLYNLYSGEDIGQPGDPTRLPDSFAERKPRGSDEDFIAKATLEEIIREETEAVLAESDPLVKAAKIRADKQCKKHGEGSAECKKWRGKEKLARRSARKK
jgi:hypothetical protein